MVSQSSLVTLPFELQEQISRCLGFFDRQCLRATCWILRRHAAPSLAEAEGKRYLVLKNLWPCYVCMRIRPASLFADNSRKTPKGRGGNACAKRFCSDCGVEYLRKGGRGGSRYVLGQVFPVMARDHVVCTICRRVKPWDAPARNPYCECAQCFPRASQRRIARAPTSSRIRAQEKDQRATAQMEAEEQGSRPLPHSQTVGEP